jgi:DNA segregation ATPase FtsK/SpoIIIE, S-DNA-T family
LKRFIILCLLILSGALSILAQQMPPDQQAYVQGTFAALRQKQINLARQQLAAGEISKAAANRTIQDSTDYIQQLRAHWVRTRYLANFEKGFNDEVIRPDPMATEPDPDLPTVLRLFFKTTLFKALVLIAGFFVSRRLWKARVRPTQPVPVDYSQIKLEYSPGEKAQLAAAKAKYDETLAALGGRENEVALKITRQAGRAGALLQHVAELKDEMTLNAMSDLDKAVPKFNAYIDGIEGRQPANFASWSSKAWDKFIQDPKPEVLALARIGEFEEHDLWSGEVGIRIPWLTKVLNAKGPIIVKCSPADRKLARTIIQGLITRAALASPAGVSFSLLDPESLGSGFPISKYLPRVRPSTPNPGDQIREIVEDIRRINTNVVAHAESFAALPAEKRAGEMFEFIAVLDYPAAYKQDSRTATDLARIAQAGPRAGRHLLLEWVTQPGDGAEKPPGMEGLSDIVLVDTGLASAKIRFDPLPESERLQQLLNAAASKKSRAPVKADWNSQIRPSEFFTFSSAQMIETPVGEGLRIWFGDNPDGRPCAHGMLAGQTGSGKSFLLHVIITGLAARYSPAELRFVLVDGKQGVEFEAYRTLPHAQVVCLRTSPSIARSVLKDFIAEMDDRYDRFRQLGVTKLEDYRRKTGSAMPRMLMVVDEFQQLLEGDSDQGASMLTHVMEKGRAAGIHLLLGSQTFEARGFPSSTMAHVHLRAALSLPVDYIQTMTALAADGKKLVRDLAASGQVVINDQGGRENANTRGAVSRLSAATGSGLAGVVSEITAAAASPLQPIVLSGNDAAVLRDNPFVCQWKSSPPDAALLQATARRSARDGGFGITAWSAADHPLPIWLGRKFDVHGHLLAPLRRAPGQNLLVLGSDSGVRLMMLAHALAALRSMRNMSGCDVLLLDGFSADQPGAGMLQAALDVLAKAGARVERAVPSTASAALERFAAAALQPKDPEAVRLLVISEPEYFPDLAAPSSFSAPPAGPARMLKELLRAGPPLGCHVVVTASGLASLSSILHPSRDAALFNHRAVQQSNEEESMTLFSSMAATRIMAQTGHFMAGMYVDNVQGVRAAQLFKAYAANPDIYADQSAAAVAAELEKLFGAEN